MDLFQFTLHLIVLALAKAMQSRRGDKCCRDIKLTTSVVANENYIL